jgi:hypothetical protein
MPEGVQGRPVCPRHKYFYGSLQFACTRQLSLDSTAVARTGLVSYTDVQTGLDLLPAGTTPGYAWLVVFFFLYLAS